MRANAERIAPAGQPRGALRGGLARMRAIASSQSLDRLCTILAVIGIALLALRRWLLVGPYPTGLDGAQWLALGRGLQVHGSGRSTDGAYAPLGPILAAIAESFAGPLLAVRLLAALSGLAVSLAVWFVARDALGPSWGLAVTAIVVPASALVEPVFFGGYPQQLALAAGLVALWASCRYLATRTPADCLKQSGPAATPPSPSALGRVPSGWRGRGVRADRDVKRIHWLAAIAALIAAGAHHIYFPLFALSILIAIGLWRSYGIRLMTAGYGAVPPSPSALGEGGRGVRVSAATRPDCPDSVSDRGFRGSVSRIAALALALAPAFALSAAVLLAFQNAGYSPPLAASAQSFVTAWEYGARESPALWFLILTSGVASLAALWPARADPAWLLSVSLLLPAGLLFLISGQSRLLPPVIIGAALAAGLGARRLSTIGPQTRAATLLVAVAVAASLIVPADRAASRFADFYRVVDESLVQAAAAIDDDGGAGAVAVRQDRRGWPIGWWFEALLRQPVIVGSDPRWLAFPDEWEHARHAESLFDGGLDASTFRQRAVSAGVHYLVIAKWEWIGWERWTTTPEFPVSVLYDDDQYLVLRVT